MSLDKLLIVSDQIVYDAVGKQLSQWTSVTRKWNDAVPIRLPYHFKGEPYIQQSWDRVALKQLQPLKHFKADKSFGTE